MLHLRNINPMVRAVGVMGAVGALVGGITFAQLTSNTVALSSNTLSTGSVNLEIGALGNRNHQSSSDINGVNNDNNTTNDNTNNTSSDVTTENTLGSSDVNTSNNTNNNNRNNTCNNTTNGTIPGFNLTGANGLLPGVQSKQLNFCLKNTSNVPLDLTVAIPDTPFTNTTGLQPSDVTLNIACGTGSTSTTLDVYNSTTTESLGTLNANSSTNCRATVTLSNTVTVTNTESLPSFDIEFTGTTTS